MGLPIHLQFLVLQYLDDSQQIKCMQVCRDWFYEIARDSKRYPYRYNIIYNIVTHNLAPIVLDWYIDSDLCLYTISCFSDDTDDILTKDEIIYKLIPYIQDVSSAYNRADILDWLYSNTIDKSRFIDRSAQFAINMANCNQSIQAIKWWMNVYKMNDIIIPVSVHYNISKSTRKKYPQVVELWKQYYRENGITMKRSKL